MLNYIKICLIQLLMLFYIVSTTRKYDLEEESLKLYGINLKQSLEEFRRTPEYLNILKNKLHEWSQSIKGVMRIIFKSELKNLTTKVNDMYNEKQDKVRASLRLREMLKKNLVPRMFPHNDDVRRGGGPQLQRHSVLVNLTGVNLLEMYDTKSILSAKDKKKIINLAYQHAGQAVHGCIRHLSPDGDGEEDTTRPSTMLDDGDDKDKESTTPHNHLVPSSDLSSDLASDEQSVTTTEADVLSTRHVRHMERLYAHY